jgi:hypothetical protein
VYSTGPGEESLIATAIAANKGRRRIETSIARLAALLRADRGYDVTRPRFGMYPSFGGEVGDDATGSWRFNR